MKKLFVIVFVVWSCSALAQEKQYMDEHWSKIAGPEGAMYYRIVENKPDGHFLVRDYYASNDQVQMEAVCSTLYPSETFEGTVRWYFENGRIKEEGDYVKGVANGLCKEYYENGQLAEEVFHGKEKTLYHQRFDESGTPLLVNGTGRYVKKFDYGEQHVEILDSILIASFLIDEISGDSIHMVAQEIAAYKGGMERLYQDIRGDLKYPRMARRSGIEGKVFIEFTVDKTGTLRDLKVLKGIGGGCDEVALEALRTKTTWTPAKVKGKPVLQRLVLPIAFKLG
ncbi:energy transducer TonB [Chryseolinea sp. H1M3-3]|uniref:energy transducer TonB n=1 Tax=Chryseolinea sp. H1M3-3 TaxID=3034144 RepID=UPI0023ED3D9D|nr:energy transducer TonB [Chryseolinea sp. H1M3-3]